MPYINPTKEYVFEDERPFIGCHASTLELLPTGEIITAYFGGTREKAPDVAIWTSIRSTDGTWSAPTKVADEEDIPHWNPVLYLRDDGVLILYYKKGKEIKEWITMEMRSTDNGRTWTEPKELIPGDTGGRGPVKNKLIKLQDGTLVAPASLELGIIPPGGTKTAWDCFVDLSYDNGETWVRSENIPIDHLNLLGKGHIQPTLWESDPGTVHMLTRTQEGFMYRSDSTDGGKTWCQAYPTEVPNNNSGFDLVKLDNGILAMVYNPTQITDETKRKGPRTPLVVRTSKDNGVTWEDEIIVDEGIKQYSYPAIIASGNELLITYTWRRERIAFWKATLS